MEDNQAGKLSSRSGKSNKSTPANLVDAKQKKQKKKKRGRRNSNKPDTEETNKHTSEEEKSRLEIEGVGALENDSEESSSTTMGAPKLPSIPSSKGEEERITTPPTKTPQSGASISLTSASTTYRPGQAAVVNSLAHKINSLTIKPKQGTGRGMNGITSRGSRQSNNVGRPGVRQIGRNGKAAASSSSGPKSAPAGVKAAPLTAFATTIGSSTLRMAGHSNSSNSVESLRWENVLEDSEEERERIRIYKINRRKRYLAAAQAKGLGWALNQSFQISDEYGLDTRSWAASTAAISQGSYQTTDYAPMQTLRASGGHGMMGHALVEC